MTVTISPLRRDRVAERVSAGAYGTVLVLASLVAVDPPDISSGIGWELITGVGLATWLAHLYAEVVGDHVRRDERLDAGEVRRAMVDGSPILLAAIGPAVVLLLARLDVVRASSAQWLAVGMAVVQLVGLGAFVGTRIGSRDRRWSYAAITGLAGLVVVTLKITLGH